MWIYGQSTSGHLNFSTGCAGSCLPKFSDARGLGRTTDFLALKKRDWVQTNYDELEVKQQLQEQLTNLTF